MEHYINQAISYDSYINLTETLLKESKTTDLQNEEGVLNYTELNLKRMSRSLKTVKISDETIAQIKETNNTYTLLVLTEGWCADAAQVLPVLRNLELALDSIELKILLREENLELMDQFQTNGTRSIPKVIILKNNEIIGDWGPRPTELMKLTQQYKADEEYTKEQFSVDVQKWYNKDKGQAIQQELANSLR